MLNNTSTRVQSKYIFCFFNCLKIKSRHGKNHHLELIKILIILLILCFCHVRSFDSSNSDMTYKRKSLILTGNNGEIQIPRAMKKINSLSLPPSFHTDSTLPIENIFQSSIQTSTTTTHRPQFVNLDIDLAQNSTFNNKSTEVPKNALLRTNNLTHQPLQKNTNSLLKNEPIIQNRANFTKSDKEELKTALLNHSLHHGSDAELDRIIFSKLPEGSKLVLRTLKIVQTDENGNERDSDPAISFDVFPTNLEVEDPEEEENVGENNENIEETHEENSEESSEESKNAKDDMASDASSHHKTGYQNYAVHGRDKEKTDNYHHGNDYGQKHTKTLTDTVGKKATNYKGKENGVTDFDHAHGNAQSNEGERFKKSKKKNKGRKVTGFKRVYHKEEFQRTEHFYDDEEAKKIAESYSLANKDEKAEHGKKDDDRKYHGKRIEHSNGEKVKNEHETSHGHHKGHNTHHQNSDKSRQTQHYSQSHKEQTPVHNHHSSHHSNYHPNHNYHGGYSNVRAQYNSPAESIITPTKTHVLKTSQLRQLKNLMDFRNKNETNEPEKSEDENESEEVDENENEENGAKLMPPDPVPDEMKIFYAQRDRQEPSQMSFYYAPNFGPPSQNNNGNNREELISEFYSKMGNATETSGLNNNLAHAQTEENEPDRYARNFPVSPVAESDPQYYLSLQKMSEKFKDQARNNNNNMIGNLISIQKAPGMEVAAESYFETPTTTTAKSRIMNNPTSSNDNLFKSNSNFRKSPEQEMRRPLVSLENNSGNKIRNNNFYLDTSNGNLTKTDVSVEEPFMNPPPTYSPRDPNWQEPSGGRHPFKFRPIRPNRNFQILNKNAPKSPQTPTRPENFGGKIIRPSQPDFSSSQNQNQVRRAPNFSHFMNGLMNSVSEFFTRYG